MRRSAPQWHIMGDNVHSRWDGVWWRPFPIYNSSVISVASITQWQPPYNIRDIYRTPCWTNNRGTLEVTQTHNWHLVKNETLIKSYFNSCKNSSNYKKSGCKWNRFLPRMLEGSLDETQETVYQQPFSYKPRWLKRFVSSSASAWKWVWTLFSLLIYFDSFLQSDQFCTSAWGTIVSH